MVTGDLIAVDWGTSSLRAYLMQDHRIVARVHTDQGVGVIEPGTHHEVLWRAVGQWCGSGAIRVVIGGMGGSSVGIIETGYVDVPATAPLLAASAVQTEWRGGDLVVLPGVRRVADHGALDVMRGEELEVFGAGIDHGTVVIAGSHSKWIEVSAGAIRDLRTYLTGELYRAASTATLLARSVAARGGRLSPEFLRAVDDVRTDPLLHLLFTVRTEALNGATPQQCADRLAGMIIGDEVRDGVERAGRPASVTLVAAGELSELYAAACGVHGVEVVAVSQDAAALGIRRVVQEMTR
jgi:2-dehydro-3-deoxygalactonokinase